MKFRFFLKNPPPFDSEVKEYFAEDFPGMSDLEILRYMKQTELETWVWDNFEFGCEKVEENG